MFNNGPKANPLKKYKLNFSAHSNEDLENRNRKDIETAATETDSSVTENIGSTLGPAGIFGKITLTQSWVAIRQNELLRRQNEQIIRQNEQILHLLQHGAPESGASADAFSINDANSSQSASPASERNDSRFFS